MKYNDLSPLYLRVVCACELCRAVLLNSLMLVFVYGKFVCVRRCAGVYFNAGDLLVVLYRELGDQKLVFLWIYCLITDLTSATWLL